MKSLLLIIPFILAIGPFESPNDLVKKGNRFYSEKKYDQALSYYDKAEEIANNKAPVIYNRGNVLLRQNDIPGAIKEYKKSASMVGRVADGAAGIDGKLKAMSLYNLGNALFADGRYEEAARAYKESIKHDSADINAKINLEIALNKKAEEEKKENQEKKDQENKKEGSKDKQEEGDKSGDNEDKKQNGKDEEKQNNDKEEQDGGEKKDDGKADERMNNEETNNENEAGSSGQNNSKQEDSADDKNTQPVAGSKTGEMTREEAERIINNMGDSNMDLQIMTDMVKSAPSGAVEKDW